MSKKFNSSKRNFGYPGICFRTRKRVENLWFLSETDAEISPFFIPLEGKGLSKEIIVAAIGKPIDSPVEEREFDDYFGRLTRVYDGANDVVRNNAERFTRLRDLLKSNLSGLRVYKIGTIRVDVLVVGIDAAGDVRGIRTFAVET